MSFRFKRHEEVAKGLRRIFTSELETAAQGLLPPANAERDKAIHEARKSVKKGRGVLRLLQPQLGEAYKIANTQLGDVGRRLSAFRDAGAMLETLAALQEAYPDELPKAKLTAVRAALTRAKAKAEHAGKLDVVFEDLAAELQTVASHAEHWELPEKGFDALAPGFQKAFRRGRKALRKALETGGDEDFHEWRKRVKDHWYHVRLLEACSPELESYGQQLRQLETWLGDDHNLVVLAQKVSQATPLLALAARRREELRAQAVELGQELYAVKPRKLVDKVQKHWDAWRRPS